MKTFNQHSANPIRGTFIVERPRPKADNGLPGGKSCPAGAAAKRGCITIESGDVVLRENRTWQRGLIFLGLSPMCLGGAGFAALLMTVIFPELEAFIAVIFFVLCVPVLVVGWKLTSLMFLGFEWRFPHELIFFMRIKPAENPSNENHSENSNSAVEFAVAPPKSAHQASVTKGGATRVFHWSQCTVVTFCPDRPEIAPALAERLGQRKPPGSNSHGNVSSAPAQHNAPAPRDPPRRLETASYEFSLCPECLAKFRTLRFDQTAHRASNQVPFNSILWHDEYPSLEQMPSSRDHPVCLDALMRLFHIRKTLWQTGGIPAQLQPLWQQAQDALPEWPGFRRLKLNSQELEALAFCEAETLELVSDIRERASVFELSDKGGGICSFTAHPPERRMRGPGP